MRLSHMYVALLRQFLAAAGLTLLALAAPRPARTAEPSPDAVEFFEKSVRPVLIDRCQSCHGETGKPEGGLELTSRASVLRGGLSGPAVVAGKPEESILVRAIRYHDEPRMPPRKRLTEEEIRDLTRWVELGLPWPDSPGDSETEPVAEAPASFSISPEARAFWSLQPVKDKAPPSVQEPGWVQTPIDAFVLSAIERAGFRPTALADKLTLIRRATFDLTGLPPTPEEIDAFLNDHSEGAFARVVDRLLASPHYGERWGRHWLDVARYADTAGETADFPTPESFRYRNYVFKALNEDKPYDRFLREQIAGDILARDASGDAYGDLLVATGFLAISRRFGYDSENYQHLTIEDTIDAVGKSILGLTVACARCHDHKFDPISNADYYALYGIFQSSRYPFPGSEKDKRPDDLVAMLPAARMSVLLKPHDEALKSVEAQLARTESACDAARQDLERSEKAAGVAERSFLERAGDEEILVARKARQAMLTAARDALRGQRAALAAWKPPVDFAYAMAEGKPTEARIQRRGDPTNLGPAVPRRVLQVLGGTERPAVGQGSGRLDLAAWLTEPKNPLTARVLVNRVWQHHFGRGIVATPSNFGKQGRPPSHPELLDHLASQFMADGWSIKRLHRRIMLSHTYRLSGDADLALRERDPENVFLARFERRRLDAESIRDAILAVSGELDRSPGGKHPFPPEGTWNFTQHTPFAALYETNRRSAYLMVQRTRRHPFLALFDGPDPNSSADRRSVTTVPTQALFFLNSEFVHRCAHAFAARLLRLPVDEPARVGAAYRLALGRPASATEVTETAEFLREATAELRGAGIMDGQLPVEAWASFARTVFSSNEFLHVD